MIEHQFRLGNKCLLFLGLPSTLWVNIGIMSSSVYYCQLNSSHDLCTYLSIEMMDSVALVEDIGHHVRGWRVDNSRRNDVGHISEVLIFWNIQRLSTVELTNSSKMNIASECILVKMHHILSP